MLIDNKYEIKVEFRIESNNIFVKLIIPKNLYKENSGIVDQINANILFGIIDNFSLN